MFQSVLTVRMSSAQSGLNSSENPTPNHQVISQEVLEAPAPGQEVGRSGLMGQVRSGCRRRLTCCNAGAGHFRRPAGAEHARMRGVIRTARQVVVEMCPGGRR